MRIAMTGGGGFIGAHLLARLVATGFDVTLLGSTTGKSRYTASLVAGGTVRHLRCDDSFAEQDILQPALADVDALVLLGYHLPASTSPAQRLAEELSRNVAPVVRLLRATESRSRHVVFASSVSVYGSPESAPVREIDVPRPQTPYAIAKLACEEAMQMLSQAAGSSATILRFSTTYGPGETVPRAIPNFIRATLAGQPPIVSGDGRDEHDYVNVADVVDAILLALRRRTGGIFNVGTGIGTTTIDLADLIIKLAAADVVPAFRAAGPTARRMAMVCATEAAERDLGFKASRQLSQGLVEEIGWFRSQLEFAQGAAIAAATT